jgi:hypothetical protein
MNNIRIIKLKDNAWPVTKPLEIYEFTYTYTTTTTTTTLSKKQKVAVLHRQLSLFLF